jgi:hypothetical protein
MDGFPEAWREQVKVNFARSDAASANLNITNYNCFGCDTKNKSSADFTYRVTENYVYS